MDVIADILLSDVLISEHFIEVFSVPSLNDTSDTNDTLTNDGLHRLNITDSIFETLMNSNGSIIDHVYEVTVLNALFNDYFINSIDGDLLSITNIELESIKVSLTPISAFTTNIQVISNIVVSSAIFGEYLIVLDA